MKEHVGSQASAIGRHLVSCGRAGLKVEILSRDREEKNLRIREAILIKRRNPTLNNKEEEAAMMGILDPIS
jgi:hypothetical protein